MRWSAGIRSWEDLSLPAEGSKAAGLNERELKMDTQLVEDMSGAWKPEQFRDSFADQIMALVRKKADAGQAKLVVKPDAPAGETKTAEIIDLTDLLKRSLRGAPAGKRADSAKAAAPNAKPATTRSTATRSSTKRSKHA